MASMVRRTIRKIFVSTFTPMNQERITGIELAFDCVGGSPRFPSYLLTIPEAESLRDLLERRLEQVNA